MYDSLTIGSYIGNPTILTRESNNPCKGIQQGSLRGSSVTIGTIQTILAWHLRKDDTHKSRSVNTQFNKPTHASNKFEKDVYPWPQTP